MAQLRVCMATPEDLGWLGQNLIPARPYYDPAYLELEREAIFKRTWLLIGHMAELPEENSFIVREVEVAKASVLIVKGKGGVLRAFHNACTHRGTRLVDEPSGIKLAFSCPYHRWTFTNEGRLQAAPDFGSFFVSEHDCGLAKVAVDQCGGQIFINLAEQPSESLREFLGPYAETLESLASARSNTFAEYVYELDANWKVAYDNFQENYHLRFVHPKTGAAVITKETPFGYPSEYHFCGPHRSQVVKKVPTDWKPGEIQALAFAKAMAADAQSAEKIDCKLFPNLFVVALSTYVFTHRIMPLSHDRSRGIVRVYWIGSDESASQRFSREFAAAALRDVHIEDISIIERGQLGLSSGAIKNINFQIHESLCRHLFNEVSQRVEAYQREAAAGATT